MDGERSIKYYIYIYMYISIYVHIYIYINIHTHTHTHTYVCVCVERERERELAYALCIQTQTDGRTDRYTDKCRSQLHAYCLTLSQMSRHKVYVNTYLSVFISSKDKLTHCLTNRFSRSLSPFVPLSLSLSLSGARALSLCKQKQAD